MEISELLQNNTFKLGMNSTRQAHLKLLDLLLKLEAHDLLILNLAQKLVVFKVLPVKFTRSFFDE